LKSTPETTPEFGLQDGDEYYYDGNSVDLMSEENVSATLEH